VSGSGRSARGDRRLKKSLGQHFLVDPQAVIKIVEAAELDASDVVLEIGPGSGVLTVPLAERAGQVIAVEIDEALLTPLRQSVADRGNVRVVHGDILAQDLDHLVGDTPYKVVANLPYYITSAILRYLLSASRRPERIVVTVQRQVAERIIGYPTRRSRHKQQPVMSLLAFSVQFYGQPQIVTRIPAGAFRPVPAVDSAVVRIDVYDPLPWGAVDPEGVFDVVRAGFAQSRKQLHNALTHGLKAPAAAIDTALEAAEIDGRRRAETLRVEEWVALSNALIDRGADQDLCLG
jgi:16S rRNA (adenine1518-N6/adenine1519-N6)-dimethyltransferase